MNDQQRREYEYWQMELHQRASMVKSHYGRGHREGHEKGHEKGREKGREEAAAEIVRNLLKNGVPVEQLSQITGLSVEKIRSFIPGTSSAAK